jgi:Ser/Thr protein kinase RdoA (MazF antagonist)
MKEYHELTERGRRNRMRQIARKALEHWSLDVVRMRALPDSTNGVFRLDTADGDKYAMRVSLGPPIGHTPEETRSEAEWLHALALQSEVPVPDPVPTDAGDYVVVESVDGVPNARPCSIYTWLDGPLLAERIDARSMEAYGFAMAKLHQAALAFDPSPAFTADAFDTVYPYDDPFVLFESVGGEFLPRSRRTVFEEAFGLVADAIAQLQRTEPMRMTHADLHVWNAKINRGRVGVFDFEDMLWGWPVQDIGTALYYLWSRDDFDAMTRHFRAGYERVAPWPDPGGQVDIFIAGRTLVIANDVVIVPEWADEAPAIFERGERRIRDMLHRLGA